MRSQSRGFLILVAVLLLAVIVAPAWSKQKASVAMILWRGMTEGEKSYQAMLKKNDKYDVQFHVIDAGQDKEKLRKIITNLNRDKYDVIYVFGTTVTDFVKGEIKDKPIVFNAVSRPIETGLIKSWEHSGNNVTGVSNAVPAASLFVTISKVLPITRLGFMYNPREPNAAVQLTDMLLLQNDQQFTLVPSPVDDDKSIPIAVAKLAKDKVDAVLFPADSFIMSRAKTIIPLLNQHRIPTIASLPELVTEHKAFIGIGPDYGELGKMAAYKTIAILDGKKPNDIPASRPERLHIRVNITTANQIGVKVPVQVLRMATVVK